MASFVSTQQLYAHYTASKGVTTDTRKVGEGQLFFALKGPNFNGNRFADQALQSGAAAVVVDEPEAVKDGRYLLVENGLKALQQLANHHRKQWQFPVIAITGSNGKTTTKELLTLCLQQSFVTYATPGNFNNHIGLPLTILGVPATAQMVVLEMGDNQLGDIAELCEIALPTHGLITNIGKDHIEGYGSFEGNIRAKSELFDFLLKTNGQIFVNREDAILSNMAKRFKTVPAVWYGGGQDALQLQSASPFVTYTAGTEKITTQLLGRYNLINMQTAFAVASFLGVDAANIHSALAAYRPTNNRSQWIEKGNNQLILDAYNANPSSVELALQNLAAMPSEKRKVCILGDMFELGEISATEHHNMVALALQLKIEQPIFIGERYFAHACEGAVFFRSKEAFEASLKQKGLANSLVLLKGSRRMALETLVELL